MKTNGKMMELSGKKLVVDGEQIICPVCRVPDFWDHESRHTGDIWGIPEY